MQLYEQYVPMTGSGFHFRLFVDESGRAYLRFSSASMGLVEAWYYTIIDDVMTFTMTKIENTNDIPSTFWITGVQVSANDFDVFANKFSCIHQLNIPSAVLVNVVLAKLERGITVATKATTPSAEQPSAIPVIRLYSDPYALVTGIYADLNYIEVSIFGDNIIDEALRIMQSQTYGGRYIQNMWQTENRLYVELIPFYYGSSGTASFQVTLIMTLFSIPNIEEIIIFHDETADITVCEDRGYFGGMYQATENNDAANIWEGALYPSSPGRVRRISY